MENKWVIYDKFGAERATVKELEYHGEWMGDEFITVTVKSPVPVEFQYGDYLVYRNSNEKYYIDYNPNKIHKASKESYGEAFVYENVKMYHESHVLKDVMFKDYVLNDNGMAYSQHAKFSFFAGSVEDLADRIQANLNKALGSNTWKVITPVWSRTHARNNITKAKWLGYYSTSAVSGITDVNISCDGISCKDALRLAYDQFALPYVIIGKNIVIGGDKGIDLSNTLEYGKGKGLFELEKNTDESQQVVTKMYAYGSSENMPLNYYANIGKTAEAAIACVSKREYIKDNPQLLLWVAKPWTEVKSAFGSNMSVTLQYRNLKVQANVRYDTYTFGKEKNDNDHALDHETEYLYFWMRQLDVEGALAFYEAVEQAGEPNNWPVTIAINSGANVNALPNDMVEHSTNYPALLSIQNLMLPGFPDQSLHDWVSENRPELLTKYRFSGWDITEQSTDDEKRIAKLSPWIESLKADTIGEREGAVYFDGSNTDVENIHPTIEGTTAELVTASSNLSDNGYLAEGTDLSFRINVKDGILNWYDAWSNADEDVYINMKTGYCTGRAFKLLSKPKKNGNWELVLERAYDSSLQRYFPYQDTATDGMSNYAQVCVNDKFVVTGIQLPKSYVDTASIKLLEAALEALDEMDHPKETYIPKIDEIEAARERDTKSAGTSLYDTIHAGLRLKFKDTADGADSENAPIVTQYIDTLTIKENGNNGIPTFDVVLRDEKELTSLQKIRNQISSMSGSGTPSSSSGTSTAEDEEKPVGGACLTPLLFELHKADPLEGDTVIDPEEWESEIEADEEAREAAENDGNDYETPLSIKSKYGHWTDYFLSALGIGSGGGGGGGTPLEWPLLQINAAGMSIDPSAGDTIVYDPSVSGHFRWGASLDTTKLARWLQDNDYKKQADLDLRYLKLASDTPQTVTGNLNLNGNLSILRTPITDFEHASDSLVLTFGETKSFFDTRYVTVNWFKKVFETYRGTTKYDPNDAGVIAGTTILDNLKILVGTWTESYVSALGTGSQGGSGGVWYLSQLEDVNVGTLSPTDNGKALIYDSSLGKWVKGTAGIDTAELNRILQWKTLTITDGSRQLGNQWNAKDGGSIDISGILTGKSWWGATMSIASGVVTGTITVGDGDIILNNNKKIKWKKSSGTDSFSMLTLDNSNGTNHFIVGEASTANNGIDTYIRGNGIVFQTVSGQTDASLTVPTSGDTTPVFYVKKLKIGSIVISEDTRNGGLHVENAGIYADTYVSALGTGSSGSSGGTPLNQPLMDINAIDRNPTAQQIGYTLVWGANGWDYGKAGMDETQLTTFLGTYTGFDSRYLTDTNLKSQYSWWGARLDANNAVTGDMTNVGSISASDNNTITRNSTGATYFRAANSNGSVELLTQSNRGLYDRTTTTWIVGTNGTSTRLLLGNVGIGNVPGDYKLDVFGSIHTSGNIILNNATNINIKDASGTEREIIRLTSGNNMYLCRGTAALEKTTSLYGYGIILRYGDSGTAGITLNSAGNTTVSGQLKASTILSCHNAGATSGTGWVHVATITVTATGSQPLKFRVTQRLRVGGELTVLFSNASSVEETVVSEFFYTGDIVGANITGGNGTFQLYIRKVGKTDKIGISLVDVGEYVNGRMNVTWVDNYYGTTSPGGTVATCRYYFANDVYMEYDSENEGVHVVNAGLYANTYVSALGTGSSGGAGGLDLELMWDSLTNAQPTDAYANTNIAVAHLGNVTFALTGTVNGTPFSYNGTSAVDLGEIGTSNLSALSISDGTTAALTYNPKDAQPKTLTVNGQKVNNTNVLTVTAGTGTLAIALADNYGDTKSPYAAKDAHYVLAGPASGNAATPAFRQLAPSDISDLSLSNGVITIGANNTITPLTDAKIKADYEWWGAKLDATTGKREGDMSNVGNISFQATGKNIGGMLYFNTASTQIKVGSDATAVTYTNGNSTNTPKLYVNGDFGVNGNVFAKAVELYNTNPYIDFHNGKSAADYTTRIIENASGVLTVRASGSGATGFVVSNSSAGRNGDYIRIGGATIYWDSTNQGLHIDKGLYSDSYVSSLGTGSGDSGGGIDMSDVWSALTENDSSHKINNSHINLNTLTINVNGTAYPYNGQSTQNIIIDTGSGSGTDTQDTAGIYQSANEKLFLIGSKISPSQEANAHAQTYENSSCYIGTDNCLYSNSKKVLSAAGGSISSGHLYLEGAQASSATSNTTQIVFGTSSAFKVALSGISSALVINSTTSVGNNNTQIGTGSANTYFNSTGKFIIGAASIPSTVTVDPKFYVNGSGYFSGDVNIGPSSSISRTDNGCSWWNGRDHALVRILSAGTAYHPVLSVKTVNGSWELGHHAGTEQDALLLTYITDTGYNNENNTAEYRLKFPKKSGTLATLDDITGGGGGDYLPLTAGPDYPLSDNMYFSQSSSGIYMKNSDGEYFGGLYYNGSNMWIGADSSNGVHHNGNTVISSGWNGSTGNTTIKIAVPGGNTATWYDVLHNGNGVTLDTAQTISGAKTFSASSTIVKGSLIVGGDNSLGLDAVLSTDNDDNLSITTGSDIYLKKNTAAQTKLTVGQASVNTSYNFYVNGSSLFNGNVGIGGYNSGYKLYVSGTASISQSLSIYGMEITKNNGVYEINTDDIRVNTDADWYGYWKSASDINKKDWVENIEVSVEDVARTPIFAFTWKDKPQRGIYMGTSAQYIQTVFPHAVDVLEDGTLAMDYGATALAAAVMTARTVMTHEEEIAALKRRLSGVEAENRQLRQEIELLKAA